MKTDGQRELFRSFLLSALLFPVFRNYIHTLTAGREGSLPHLGQIQDEAFFIIHETFGPFLKIPKKIASSVVSVLTSQFRFTPLEKKRRSRYRIPNVPDFQISLDFLSLRASIEPGLDKLHEEWLYYWNKHQKWKTKPR